MLNLGPVSKEWLRAIGVHSLNDLKRQGSVKTYLKVKNKGFNTSLNLLWALEGAILNRPWQSFTTEEKNKLKEKLK